MILYSLMTPYKKATYAQLRLPFNSAESILENYSQSYQDMFVLTMLNGKKNGTYLEIGAFDPIFISNTYLLEKDFGWTGVSIDIEPPVEKLFHEKRKSTFLLSDALAIDYRDLFQKNNLPKQIDYLSIDIEPKTQTLECLKKLPLDTYRFSVITYETDYYDSEEGRDVAERVRNESRELLLSHGYELVVGNIANTGPHDVFEDWYVDPKIIDTKIIAQFKLEKDFNDSAERFMLKKGSLVVCNEFYNGQGLGNQLWNYVVTRIIAKERGASFSILGKEKFKGKDFINLEFGKELHGGSSPEGGPAHSLPDGIRNYYMEKRENLLDTTTDISRTDNDLFAIPLNTKIDGNFQSTKYLKGYRDDILNWIKIKDDFKKNTTNTPTCVIHIRCGDFAGIKNVFLPVEYYRNAIKYLRTLDATIQFCCVTDEPQKVRELLPEIEIVGSSVGDTTDPLKAPHHLGGPIGIDFCLLMNADYLIIPNSSFSWWAAYLNTTKKAVVAPKYWAAYNTSNGYWSTSDIITDDFTYLDRFGTISSATTCWDEKNHFESQNQSVFTVIKNPSPTSTPRFSVIKKYVQSFKNILKSLLK